LAPQNAYPIAEGSTTCVLTTFNNLGCLIFLLLPNVPGINEWPAWANWSLVGGSAVSVVILFTYQERKRRTSYDMASSPNPDDFNEKKPLSPSAAIN
jgi:FLVCR family MFS transporter